MSIEGARPPCPPLAPALHRYNRHGRFWVRFWAGNLLAVSSVVKRSSYWCGRCGVRFPGRSNRHSVVNGSPLQRFCVPQALSRGNGPQWCTQGRGSGVNTFLPLTISEKKEHYLFLNEPTFLRAELAEIAIMFFLFCPTF